MPEPVPPHLPGRLVMPAESSTACETAGQRAAAIALGEAVAERQTLILLFGEAGVGKSTVISRFLAAANADEFVIVQLSATSGEFIGPPSFDNLLEAVCRRIVAPQPAGQRPATLAVLATTLSGVARAGGTLLLAIDHADHLTDDVIAEVTRLSEYLDASPASVVCIFIGSPGLASRLDSVQRRRGTGHRMVEIRLSQPSREELSALLAYEDSAQLGGPMLTPGAIDRITAYAKSNLHWAVPLADAARTLAVNEGEREVTPELVRGALLEIWSPEQPPPSDTLTRQAYTFALSTTDLPCRTAGELLGLSDVPANRVDFGSNAGAAVISPAAYSDPNASQRSDADSLRRTQQTADVAPAQPSEHPAEPAEDQAASTAAAEAAAPSADVPAFSVRDTTTSSAEPPDPALARFPARRWVLAGSVLLSMIGIISVLTLISQNGRDTIGQQRMASETAKSQPLTSQLPASSPNSGLDKPLDNESAAKSSAGDEQIGGSALPETPPNAAELEAPGAQNEHASAPQAGQTFPLTPHLAETAPKRVPAAHRSHVKPGSKKKSLSAPPNKVHKTVPLDQWIQTR